MRSVFALLIASGVVAGCAPANVAGSYTGTVTNGTSTCPGNWTNGNSTSVTFDVAQSGGNVTVNVNGTAGGLLSLWLGTRTFSGTAGGSGLTATLIGTTAQTAGNCRYNIRADMDARLSSNTLEGTVTYRPDIIAPASPDCDTMRVTGCSESQAFNGIRPPASP